MPFPNPFPPTSAYVLYEWSPSTYMLLEKMRGSAPKLLDSTHCGPSNQDLVFSGQKPADSGKFNVHLIKGGVEVKIN